MFPPNGSVTRRPLPSPGSSRVEFPGFLGTMRRSDSLPPVPPRFVSLRLAIPSRVACVRSRSGPTPTGGQGFVVRLSPAPDVVEMETQGVPSSWGTLMCLCPVLRPRQDRYHQAIAVRRRGPRVMQRRRLPRVMLSRLNSTASALAVYASPGGSPAQDARLASGCWPGSTGRDWLPAGFQRKVSKVYSLHLFLLSQVSWRKHGSGRQRDG